MLWTLSLIIYNLIMQLGVYRGKLTSEMIISMWLVVFVVGAIELNGYKKSSK